MHERQLGSESGRRLDGCRRGAETPLRRTLNCCGGMGHTDRSANQLAREVRRRKRLQADLSDARRSLALRTAELDASQAKLAESEQNLRTIRDSPTYRLAQRLWGLRRATRDRLRFRGNSSGVDKEASV